MTKLYPLLSLVTYLLQILKKLEHKKAPHLSMPHTSTHPEGNDGADKEE